MSPYIQLRRLNDAASPPPQHWQHPCIITHQHTHTAACPCQVLLNLDAAQAPQHPKHPLSPTFGLFWSLHSSATAGAGLLSSCRHQPLARSSSSSLASSGTVASVLAEPSSTSLVLARVMATFTRCQSASSRPASLQRSNRKQAAHQHTPCRWTLARVLCAQHLMLMTHASRLQQNSTSASLAQAR